MSIRERIARALCAADGYRWHVGFAEYWLRRADAALAEIAKDHVVMEKTKSDYRDFRKSSRGPHAVCRTNARRNGYDAFWRRRFNRGKHPAKAGVGCRN